MVANGGKLVANGGKLVANGGKLVANWWQTSDFLRFCVLYDFTLVEPRGEKYCCGEQKGSFVL